MSARYLVRLTTVERDALLLALHGAVDDSAPTDLPEGLHATLARVQKKVKGAPLAKRPKRKKRAAPA